MFGIQHRGDGTWWTCGEGLTSGWHLDPDRARRFVSREDAISIAYLECAAVPLDYDAAPLPPARPLVVPATPVPTPRQAALLALRQWLCRHQATALMTASDGSRLFVECADCGWQSPGVVVAARPMVLRLV